MDAPSPLDEHPSHQTRRGPVQGDANLAEIGRLDHVNGELLFTRTPVIRRAAVSRKRHNSDS